eukprot:gnl/MRDRNA2_/MRDRNA2_98490_c0_seq1.p1 gnl/MRDRNA2_/MRDRNA2_98490_c0~~gnl/MRDRNA2_/MRDRNA2_98490_c0_seq1.p1  ORF type:complete len:529 (+),score=89.99 gnl/MRDRNA2_/MRDRNA2_98490_c0_seq1:62-1648(+)
MMYRIFCCLTLLESVRVAFCRNWFDTHDATSLMQLSASVYRVSNELTSTDSKMNKLAEILPTVVWVDSPDDENGQSKSDFANAKSTAVSDGSIDYDKRQTDLQPKEKPESTKSTAPPDHKATLPTIVWVDSLEDENRETKSDLEKAKKTDVSDESIDYNKRQTDLQTKEKPESVKSAAPSDVQTSPPAVVWVDSLDDENGPAKSDLESAKSTDASDGSNDCDKKQTDLRLKQKPESTKSTALPYHKTPVKPTDKVANDAMMMPGRTASVPKLIHFMYKEDLSRPASHWPNPIWNVSFRAWKTYFPEPEYKYLFWTDSSVDEVFKEKCPEHYNRFSKFTFEIYRADLGRYCILKCMGGIYSDLDYEPRSNFYNDLLPGKVSLIESPYDNENFQNSLMASPKGFTFSEYWMGVLDTFASQSSEPGQQSQNPDKITGPHIVDAFTQSLQSDASALVNKLPCKDFQRKIHTDTALFPKKECGFLTSKDAVKGIHWGTVSWVKDGRLSPELAGDVHHDGTVNLFHSMHPDIPI